VNMVLRVQLSPNYIQTVGSNIGSMSPKENKVGFRKNK
jgi:hypothetical protein